MLIIQFLNSCFQLYYLDHIISPDLLEINNIQYIKDKNSKVSKGFLGFFDWLRLTESKIVGIRICYLEDQPYNRLLQRYPYVTPTFNCRCMEILFEGETYDFNLSGDQDFSNNYVYNSESGSYLFTFGLDHLTKEETNSVLQYCETLNK